MPAGYQKKGYVPNKDKYKSNQEKHKENEAKAPPRTDRTASDNTKVVTPKKEEG